MKTNVKLNTKRDLDLFFFLWKWKIAPSIVLLHKFFPERKFVTVYNRLMKLAQGGFIESISVNREYGSVWILAERGFKCIKDSLPMLSEVGYKCENMTHDLLVNSVHSGGWYKKIPEGAEILTEQELRRLEVSELPIWVPKTDLHRPDGYWLSPFNDGYRTVALEVELNYKNSLRYGTVGRVYENSEEVSEVIWVVKTKQMGEKIFQDIKNGIHGSRYCHSFYSLNDFLKQGWQAVSFLGQRSGSTMHQLLHEGVKNQISDDSITFLGHYWLDTRKIPTNPELSISIKNYHF